MTHTTQRSTVVGVFESLDQARGAIEALKSAGFAAETISVLSPDKQGGHAVAEETGAHAGAGAATGAVAGGILGGLGGWLVGIGALAIPGIGPFIAAGAFATALGGAAVGAGVGAIAGALVGMGVPKDEAEYYEGEVKSGRTLVTVRADGRYDAAQRLLRQHGAYDIESRAGTPIESRAGLAAGAAGGRSGDLVDAERRTAAGPRSAADQDRLELREEELQPRKTAVETGQVTLGKEVVEEQRSVEVPLKREDVYVERRPVDRPAEHPIGADSGQTIDVPVHREQVEVEKQPVDYEEVSAGTQPMVHQQPVSETVRREELQVETEGSPRLGGVDTPASWEQAMPSYRQRWQQRYGTSGQHWEDYQAFYQYGHELRGRPEYRGRPWADIEPDVQRDWQQRNPTGSWTTARECVRDAWSGVGPAQAAGTPRS